MEPGQSTPGLQTALWPLGRLILSARSCRPSLAPARQRTKVLPSRCRSTSTQSFGVYDENRVFSLDIALCRFVQLAG